MMRLLKNKVFFVLISLVLLIFGLIGNQRLYLRTDMQFQWREKGNRLIVEKISENGTADRSGLLLQDIILQYNQNPVYQNSDLIFLSYQQSVGQPVSLTVQRGDRQFNIELTLAAKCGKRFILINLFLGVLFWLIGIVVFLIKSSDNAARVFSWGSVIIGISSMMVWHGYPVSDTIVTYLTTIVYDILLPLIPPFILIFFVIYPKPKQILTRFPVAAYLVFLPSVLFIIIRGGSYLTAVLQDSLHYFHLFYEIDKGMRAFFIVYLLLSFTCMVHSYRIALSRESKNKILWIIFGIFVGAFPFLFLWTLPQVFGLQPWIPEELTGLFLILTPLSFAFSIVKYQLLDIEIIINRSIVYSLVTGLIVLFYLALIGGAGLLLQSISTRTNNYITIMATLGAAVAFTPLKSRIQLFVDKTFYRVKYNYQIAMKEFIQTVAAVNDEQEMIDLLLEKINDAIPMEKIALMRCSTSGKTFHVSRGYGLSKKSPERFNLDQTSRIIRTAQKKTVPLARYPAGIHNAENLPDIPFVKKENIDLIVPIHLQQRLRGLLLLGRKMSGRKFSDEDLGLIIPMAEESMMALERLKLKEHVIIEKAEKRKHKELSKLKSVFISHVSHELKSPLTAMEWSLENLLEGIPEKPTKTVCGYLEGIYDNSKYLERMINNLLNITKIEAGKIESVPEVLNLRKEVERSVKRMMPLFEKKKISIECGIPELIKVKADADCLQAIIGNLLDNGIKYSTEKSRILVTAGPYDGNSDPKNKKGHMSDQIKIIVKDEGRGIPAVQLTAIFDRFERVKKEKAEREKGLGLGLHIVKKLIELQGGKIWVESKIDRGSCFIFTLPKS